MGIYCKLPRRYLLKTTVITIHWINLNPQQLSTVCKNTQRMNIYSLSDLYSKKRFIPFKILHCPQNNSATVLIDHLLVKWAWAMGCGLAVVNYGFKLEHALELPGWLDEPQISEPHFHSFQFSESGAELENLHFKQVPM